MKKYSLKKYLLIGILIAIIILFSSSVYANTMGYYAPGTADDPLITLSYLEKILSSGGITNSNTAGGSTAAAVDASYTVVELKQGDRLYPTNGSLELIARPGAKTVVVSPFTDQGVADLTDGSELLNNEQLPLNHLLLIPRADGRGILVVSDVAYIMIRGNYEIK